MRKPIRIRVAEGEDGLREVPVYNVIDGLAIHHTMEHDESIGPSWTLTHMESDLAIYVYIPKLELAKRLRAEMLATRKWVGVTMEEIVADKVTGQLVTDNRCKYHLS